LSSRRARRAAAERRPGGPSSPWIWVAWLGGGFAMALPFRAHPAEWLAFVAPVPWLAAIEADGARAFRRAYAGGVVFLVAGLSWLNRVSPLATVLAALYFALYVGLFGWMAAELRHRVRWPLWLAAPVAWMTAELAAEHLTVFNVTWLFAGSTLWRCATLSQLVEIGGVSLVSGFVLGTAAVILHVLQVARAERGRWRERGTWRPLVLWGTIAGLALGWGQLRMRSLHLEEGPRMALVQGNVAQSERLDPSRRDAVLVKHAQLTSTLSPGEAILVAWPESTSAHFLDEDVEARRFLGETARRAAAWMLVGGIGSNPPPEPPSNSAFLFAPDGQVAGRSDKRVLVPGAETLLFLDRVQALREPIGAWLSKHMGFRPYLKPGGGPVVLTAGALRFGTLICYGDLVPGPAWDLREAGAQALVAISNEAWFGSLELDQHLAMATQRCIETRLPMARATNDGLTAFVDPAGRVRASLPRGHEGVLSQPVLLARTWAVPAAVRLATRLVITACGVLALLVAWRRERASRAALARGASS